jgi:transposase InsO family protein
MSPIEKLKHIEDLLAKGNWGHSRITINGWREGDRLRFRLESHSPQTLDLISKRALRDRGYCERIFPDIPFAPSPEEAINLWWHYMVEALDENPDLALAVGQSFMGGPGEFKRHVYRWSNPDQCWVLQ